MNFKPVKTPNLVKNVFPGLIWDLPSKEKIIYLTFDDGPTPTITDWTLDVLRQYDARVTFFCIGKNIKAHPAIFQRILSEGHSVGNHTYNHLKGWKTNTSEYLENIDKTDEVITHEIANSKIPFTGMNPSGQSGTVKLFRPPYGQIKPKQAKQIIKLGYKIVMWTVLSRDWEQSLSKEKCVENVTKHTNPGNIIVFHDSIKASNNLQYALPEVLEYFSRKGFKFKRIPE